MVFSEQADEWINSHAENFDGTTGGFSPDDERALRNHFKALGFSDEAAAEAARRGANNRRYFWQRQGRPAPDRPSPSTPSRTPQGGPRGSGMPSLPSGAPMPGVQ